MTSRGLAPGLSPERATTVAAPPERWFLGDRANLTGVDLLRQVHAPLPDRDATGASEPTATCHGTSGGRRIVGQNINHNLATLHLSWHPLCLSAQQDAHVPPTAYMYEEQKLCRTLFL